MEPSLSLIDIHRDLTDSFAGNFHAVVAFAFISHVESSAAFTGAEVLIVEDVGKECLFGACVEASEMVVGLVVAVSGLHVVVAIAVEALNLSAVYAFGEFYVDVLVELEVESVPVFPSEIVVVATTFPDAFTLSVIGPSACRDPILICGTLVEAGVVDIERSVDGIVESSPFKSLFAFGYGDDLPLSVEVFGVEAAALCAYGCLIALAAVYGSPGIPCHVDVAVVVLENVVDTGFSINGLEIEIIALRAVAVATVVDILAWVFIVATVAEVGIDVEAKAFSHTFLGLESDYDAGVGEGSVSTPVGTTGEELLLTNVVDVEIAAFLKLFGRNTFINVVDLLGSSAAACEAECLEGVLILAAVGSRFEFLLCVGISKELGSSEISVDDTLRVLHAVDGLLKGVDGRDKHT